MESRHPEDHEGVRASSMTHACVTGGKLQVHALFQGCCEQKAVTDLQHKAVMAENHAHVSQTHVPYLAEDGPDTLPSDALQIWMPLPP